MNKNEVYCKGSPDLGTDCGTCVRCLRRLLKRMEWSGSGDIGRACPLCQGIGDHINGCNLERALRDE